MEFNKWFNEEKLMPAARSCESSVKGILAMVELMTEEDKEQYMVALTSLVRVADVALNKAWLIAYEVKEEREKAERSKAE